MARAKKASKIMIDLKKQLTFNTMLVSDKSIIIVDPDNLRDGEEFVDNPPSRGYTECWVRGVLEYTVYPLTITQLNEHLNEDTLSGVIPLGKVAIASDYGCVCNSRNPVDKRVDKQSYTLLDHWSGKIYVREYDVNVSLNKKTATTSFITFEGVKSGRGGTNLICWPTQWTPQHLSTIVK